MNIAVLFPGQGVQQKGMEKWLLDNFETARRVFEEASDYLNMDIRRICSEGGENLNKTEITQPVVLTASVAAARAVSEELGLQFCYGAGHSLGEYSALTVAGGLEFKDALQLVSIRGKLMQEAVTSEPGAMSVINGCDYGTVEGILKEMQYKQLQVEISNYNSPYQIVISGLEKDVAQIEERLREFDVKIIRLKVSAPFHCSIMRPAAEKMNEVLRNINLQPLKFPVISNVTGVPYHNMAHIKECLVAQMTRCVEWRKSMQFLYTSGVDMVIDAGPGEVVRNLMTRNCTNLPAFSLEKDWDKLLHIAAAKKEGYNAD